MISPTGFANFALTTLLQFKIIGAYTMRRRNFLMLGGGAALGLIHHGSAMPVPFQDEKSKLKITGVRLVQTQPKRPLPKYEPTAGSWSTGGVEVANPMSIYPEYKPQRSLLCRIPANWKASLLRFRRTRA